MWRILSLAAMLSLVIAPPALGGPTPPETAISGFAPYMLGAGTAEVLGADLELTLGNYPMWTNTLVTQRYGRPIVAPIGGVNGIATLGLQFWQGRLAVVIVKWPGTTFDSEAGWRRAAESLHGRIINTFARGVVRQHTVLSASVWTVDLTDAAGNELLAWANNRPRDLTMIYLWGPYLKALESPAPGNLYEEAP